MATTATTTTTTTMASNSTNTNTNNHNHNDRMMGGGANDDNDDGGCSSSQNHAFTIDTRTLMSRAQSQSQSSGGGHGDNCCEESGGDYCDTTGMGTNGTGDIRMAAQTSVSTYHGQHGVTTGTTAGINMTATAATNAASEMIQTQKMMQNQEQEQQQPNHPKEPTTQPLSQSSSNRTIISRWKSTGSLSLSQSHHNPNPNPNSVHHQDQHEQQQDVVKNFVSSLYISAQSRRRSRNQHRNNGNGSHSAAEETTVTKHNMTTSTGGQQQHTKHGTDTSPGPGNGNDSTEDQPHSHSEPHPQGGNSIAEEVRVTGAGGTDRNHSNSNNSHKQHNHTEKTAATRMAPLTTATAPPNTKINSNTNIHIPSPKCHRIRHLPRTVRWKIQWNLWQLPPEEDDAKCKEEKEDAKAEEGGDDSTGSEQVDEKELDDKTSNTTCEDHVSIPTQDADPSKPQQIPILPTPISSLRVPILEENDTITILLKLNEMALERQKARVKNVLARHRSAARNTSQTSPPRNPAKVESHPHPQQQHGDDKKCAAATTHPHLVGGGVDDENRDDEDKTSTRDCEAHDATEAGSKEGTEFESSLRTASSSDIVPLVVGEDTEEKEELPIDIQSNHELLDIIQKDLNRLPPRLISWMFDEQGNLLKRRREFDNVNNASSSSIIQHGNDNGESESCSSSFAYKGGIVVVPFEETKEGQTLAEQTTAVQESSTSPPDGRQEQHDTEHALEMSLARAPYIEWLALILFAYAKEHPHIGYRQGMHEILAYIVLALEHDLDAGVPAHQDKEAATTSAPPKRTSTSSDSLQQWPPILLVSRANLRTDAYLLFEAWMEGLKPAYRDSLEESPSPHQNHNGNNVNAENTNQADEDGDRPSEHTKRSSRTIISKTTSTTGAAGVSLNLGERILQLTAYASSNVHHVLYKLTHDMGVPPELYCAKWLRLLFGREFSHRIHVLEFWDFLLDSMYDPWHILWHTPPLQERVTNALVVVVPPPEPAAEITSTVPQQPPLEPEAEAAHASVPSGTTSSTRIEPNTKMNAAPDKHIKSIAVKGEGETPPSVTTTAPIASSSASPSTSTNAVPVTTLEEAQQRVQSNICLMDVIECVACSMILLQRKTLVQNLNVTQNSFYSSGTPQTNPFYVDEDMAIRDGLCLLMNYPTMTSPADLMVMTTRVARFHLEHRLGMIVPKKNRHHKNGTSSKSSASNHHGKRHKKKRSGRNSNNHKSSSSQSRHYHPSAQPPQQQQQQPSNKQSQTQRPAAAPASKPRRYVLVTGM
jgi:hypothetical protein